MRPADELFTEDALATLRAEIGANGGREIFFTALWKDGLVRTLEALARGSDEAVPVLFDMPADRNTVIHNHPSGDITPSEADLAVAARLLNDAVAFLIVDNRGEQVNVVVDPTVISEPVRIDPEESAGVFLPGGALEKCYPGFEHRASQAGMARLVQEVLNEGRHGVVEAPTGTGKSLAYLYPLVRWGRANRKRVLVCTHTIPLQQQLLDQDIPVTAALLGEPLTAAVVKGRQNYLCLRKLEEAMTWADELFEDAGQQSLVSLARWAEKSGEGSLQEIDFEVPAEVWAGVASDGDSCLGMRCPRGSDCFFRKSRRQAVEADLVIANHALFFSDLVLRGERGKDSPVSVIPWCERVVLDEAHNLEEGATGHFGRSFSASSLLWRLSRFHSRRRKRERGTLVMLQRALVGKKNTIKTARDLLEETVLPALDRLRTALPELSERINTGCRQLQSDRRERTLRLTPALRHLPGFRDDIVPALEELSGLLGVTGKAFTRLYDAWLDMEEQEQGSLEAHFLRIASGARRFEEDRVFLQGVLNDFDENQVWWAVIAPDQEPEKLSLNAAPVCVGPLLQEHLYDRFDGVVYTSATLTVGGSFDYYLKRVGLAALEERLALLRLPPVFDYERRSFFTMPAAFPSQDHPDFIGAFAEFAAALIQTVGGRIFFLFTSWQQLGSCHEAVLEKLPEGWRPLVLRQEAGGRSRELLLLDYRSTPGAVLFGVSSFWEGVDVKGESLIGVVIVKLPFQVPSDPVVQARQEQLEAAGSSSFMEYSLPNAVIRFKQGIGRLIRTRDDYGFICVLDNRLQTKQYGRLFLETVPGRPPVIDNGPGVVRRTAEFLKGFG